MLCLLCNKLKKPIVNTESFVWMKIQESSLSSSAPLGHLMHSFSHRSRKTGVYIHIYMGTIQRVYLSNQ